MLGLALLILFQTPLGRAVERIVPVTFAVPSVVLAQFTVACAFAVRTMRVTFDQIDPRGEHVALTLGCSRWQAFWMVAVPEARRGDLHGGHPGLGPLVGRVRPDPRLLRGHADGPRSCRPSVFLELSTGNIEAAAAVSLMMVVTAMIVLVAARMFGLRGTGML